MRPSGRAPNALRAIQITRKFTRYAEGSVLIEFGNTKVLCTASIDEKTPPFLKGRGQGWVTAEYGMLPRATGQRTQREAARGKQDGRTVEIQRLIGRSLRAAVDLKALGERTITIDCDVLQADGGTRTASITGGYVALVDAVRFLKSHKVLKDDPLRRQIASISVGIHQGEPVLDLDYSEDSSAGTDMNFVMDDGGGFIEIQGTAEHGSFQLAEMLAMAELARNGIKELMAAQNAALALTP